MTHNDIFTKFMIEYDKADVTSSYPSLTDYEIAVLLDKAYLALIAQKVTGNNIRRSAFESDLKSIADLQGLITTDLVSDAMSTVILPANVRKYNLPSKCEYFLSATLTQATKGEPADEIRTRAVPVKLVPYEVATKFFITPHNLPWIKTPVCYIQDGSLFVVYDSIDKPSDECNVTYIKTPAKFTKDSKVFECSDTMAEELISLAITFALETVESTRLTAKLNTRGLEA